MKREIVGTIGNIFILASYMFNNKKLRIVNLIGTFFLLIYGFMLEAFSAIMLNVIKIFIHLYKLRGDK
jgi:hypothetical protein